MAWGFSLGDLAYKLQAIDWQFVLGLFRCVISRSQENRELFWLAYVHRDQWEDGR